MYLPRSLTVGTLVAVASSLLATVPATAAPAPEPPEPYLTIATQTLAPVTTTPDFRQSYTVPAGADALLLSVAGAAGQSWGSSVGGRGGHTWALVPATPGEAFTFLVGNDTDQGGGGVAVGDLTGNGGGASYVWGPTGDLLVISSGGGGAGYGSASHGWGGRGATTPSTDPDAGKGADAVVRQAGVAPTFDFGFFWVSGGAGGGGYVPGEHGTSGAPIYTNGTGGGTAFAAAAVTWVAGIDEANTSTDGSIEIRAIDYAGFNPPAPTPPVAPTPPAAPPAATPTKATPKPVTSTPKPTKKTATKKPQVGKPRVGITGLSKSKNGRYSVTKSKTYKIYYVSKKRPRLLFATPAPGKPYRVGPRLQRDGSVDGVPRWSIRVRIDSSTKVYKKWNLGVRIGKTTKTIPISVRR